MSRRRVSHVERVYRLTHPRLWRALLAYTGDPDLASDAESEAFAQALRRGPAVRDLEAWVWRAGFNIARGQLAKRSELIPLAIDDVDRAYQTLDETVDDLSDYLRPLSEQQRACIVLKHVGQLAPREIAEVIGTSANTVRNQLSRAHAQLRMSTTE